MLMFTSEQRVGGEMGDDKSDRKLKVVRSFSDRSRPALRLSGCWLEQAGFIIDMRVRVIVRDKCLVVLPLEDCGD